MNKKMKLKRKAYWSLALAALLIAGVSCTSTSKKKETMKKTDDSYEKGTYGYDVQFLNENEVATIELKNEESGACLLVSPGYQGRVMTCSLDGMQGNSFGWINYDLVASGEVKEQFNPVGGEERIWIGPEGGPYSVYFAKGKEQSFENWQVPKEIDTVPFDVMSKESESVVFQKSFQLANAMGNIFNVGIERGISLLSQAEVEQQLNLEFDESLKCVAYESANKMTNEGVEDWTEDTGVLSIWMLSMFNPSEKGVVVIPYNEAIAEGQSETIVNDDYFGKVPAERLKVGDGKIFFKVDGKLRSKIGLPPHRAKEFCGAYDPDNKVLTLLWYTKPADAEKYVNSKWGIESGLLEGDAVNSYNDGPVDDGSIMGPFYEIESSSPALFLASGESYTHTQRIYHISGNEDKLNEIAKEILGVTIEKINQAF